MTQQTTQEVNDAYWNVPQGIPFAEQIQDVLGRAAFQAWEQEMFWQEQGTPHLRTFLKTTPLGIAILELARAINEEAKS